MMEIKKTIKAMSLKEALEALSLNKNDSALIAGGTDIMLKLREKELEESVIIDISDVPEMKKISIGETEIRIGAAVTFTEVTDSKEIKETLNGLWEACKSVGAPQIRNMGTVGGNIANGSPAADSVPAFLALGAKLIIASSEGESEIELANFFVGKGKTALEKGSLIKEIVIPVNPGEKMMVAFSKLGLRNALAISRISTAVCIDVESGAIKSARVASGSIGLIPTVESDVASFLVGKKLNDITVAESVEYFSSVVAERLKGRSTAPFKQEAIKGVFRDALEKVFAQAKSSEVL